MDKELLFSPYQIGACTVKNRYAMVAMGTGGMVNIDGTFNERGIEYYVERAKGGVGLIITGTMYVENDIEHVLPGVMPMPTLNPNRFIINSSEMVERVHAYDCKIFAQLTAGFGRVMTPHLLVTQPVSASNVESFWGNGLMCRELSIPEIKQIVDKCAESAYICKQAGYDGVEIHAVHEGYLLDQFAISLFNNRTDEYGGDLRNRLRFACEVVQRIKERCGKDFPVALRYSLKSFIKEGGQGGLPGEDFIELGRDIEEGLEAAKILEEAGYDCLDVDSGSYEAWYWAHPPVYHKDGLNIEYGKMVKSVVDVPVIIAGKMHNPDVATDAIKDGATDIIGLGRSLLADPYVVKKIKEEKMNTIRPCLGCHEGCMHRLVSSKSMSCAVNPIAGREKSFALQPALTRKKVVIIGAGIAGLECARVLSLRGHRVQIYEKTNRIGGLLNVYCDSGYKADYRTLLQWYEQEMKNLSVEIFFNSEMDDEDIRKMQKDVVIVATGSKPRELWLSDNQNIYYAQEVFENRNIISQEAVIVGGGMVGCELALELAEQGKQVLIIEAKEMLLGEKGMPVMNRKMLLDMLALKGVRSVAGALIEKYEENEITYKVGEERYTVKADHLISAIGYQEENTLYQQLSGSEENVYVIGDAKKVKNIMYAIWDAYEICNGI